MKQTARSIPPSLTFTTLLVLGGCASSLSGLGSPDGYACKAPIGAQCSSVSGVYANADSFLAASLAAASLPPQGLPDAPTRKTDPALTGQTVAAASGLRTARASASIAAPLRSSARVLRLWIAPWEDADGDLHEASFVHVVVDTGHWLIDRVRPAPRAPRDFATPPLVQPSVQPSASSFVTPSLPLNAPFAAPAPEARPATELAPTES